MKSIIYNNIVVQSFDYIHNDDGLSVRTEKWQKVKFNLSLGEHPSPHLHYIGYDGKHMIHEMKVKKLRDDIYEFDLPRYHAILQVDIHFEISVVK